MSETKTKTEEKKDAASADTQTVNVEATPPETESTASAPPKPHKKSNYVTLMPGQSENTDLHAGMTGSMALVAIRPKHGQVFKLVDTDTTDPNTISRAMGVDLVNKGFFVYTDAPDKDAEPFVPSYDPATPQGDMLANGIAPGGKLGTVSVGEGKSQVFVPAPFMTTPDGGAIPVAPQPGFTSAESPLVDAGTAE